MPTLDTGAEDDRWRDVWVHDLATGNVRRVRHTEMNIWEATWCGNEAVAAIVSAAPGEGRWYGANLQVIEMDSGIGREVYSPREQMGCLAASPSGKQVAFVEGICSDRGLVAGALRLLEVSSGKVQPLETRGVDITYTEWRSDHILLVAGHREFETVVGLCDVICGTFTEVWVSRSETTSGTYATVSGFTAGGDCVIISESFQQAPEIGLISRGRYKAVKSFDLGYADQAEAINAVECVTWPAPDGLEIQGWLLLPKGNPPYPLVMLIHGGPVWHWRPTWLGRRSAHILMLIRRGYAVFFPNPRGSTGRGQDFARRVVGDMGGADTYDCLSGLDYLTEQGIADPKRLGVSGGSYGGFMTSWLITQDARFAAAIAVAPVTNHVTEHLISNIPHFTVLFLADSYTNLAGKYFERSPIMHAHKVKTPTLSICGALDRCTPAEEAVQFHSALLANGVKSVLITYPQEGHGVRMFPAIIDYGARVVGWFEEHISNRLALDDREIGVSAKSKAD
jgi:dipeptidyl aminopeptidase/acylaminoacyl peptidase